MLEKRFSFYYIMANIIMSLVTIAVILPFLLLFMSSISSETSLVANGYNFWPSEFSLESYRYILQSGDKIMRAYGMTFIVTIIGTVVHVALCALISYPLSLKNLPARNVLTFIVVFAMLFNGGLVPTYYIYSNIIGVKDSIWGLILPSLLLSPLNILLVRTYYSTSIPDTLYEAAQIDGASQMRIFSTIVIPLGKPILITIGTFAGLGYWNDWTNGLYYIVNKTELYTIQNVLNKMVTDLQYITSNSTIAAASGEAISRIPTTGVQMAIAFVAILPILILFPFLQKYYSKGISLGAVKG